MTLPGAAADWRLSVPAGTPYDREVLLQCLRSTVARWGAVSLAVGGHRLLVAGGDPAVPCAGCARPAGPVQCRDRGRVTCLRCAVERAGAEQGEEATLALRPVADAGRHAQRKPQRPQRRNAATGRTSSSAI